MHAFQFQDATELKQRDSNEQPTPSSANSQRASGVDDMHPYANKYPKPLLSGLTDLQKTSANSDRIAAMYVINSMLKSDKRLAQDLRGFIEQSEVKPVERKDDAWPASYNEQWKIPAYFLCRCMEVYTQGKLKFDTMNAYEETHPGSIRKMHTALTGIHDDDYVPTNCRARDVMCKTFNEEYKLFGNRGVNFWETAFDDDGLIDWWKVGPYHIEFNDAGVCINITHRSSKQVGTIPPYIQVTHEFCLIDGFSDRDAWLQGPKLANYKLVEFFKDDDWVNIHRLDEKSTRLKTTAATILNAPPPAEISGGGEGDGGRYAIPGRPGQGH